MMRVPQRQAWVQILVTAVPAVASAHVIAGDLGDAGNAAVHLLFNLPSLLVVLSLALLFEEGRTRSLLFSGIVSLCSFVAGYLVGYVSPVIPVWDVLFFFACILAVMVVLDKTVPSAVQNLLIGISAFMVGMDTGIGTDVFTLRVFSALLGSWCLMTLFILGMGILSSFAKPGWVRVMVRILGSWIAAIALLALAFSLVQ